MQLKLIALYSFIQECYDKELQWHCQRFSTNKLKGTFSDEEILTCYFFAILEEQKFDIKKIHEYIKKYWHDWFPDLPSYSGFNYRLNRLADALPLLLGLLSAQVRPTRGFHSKDLLIDSVPIILCKGKRKGKIASEMAAKTYSSSKGIFYYGLKLHWMGMSQAAKLPLPIWMEVSDAATHDLPVFKGILEHLHDCRIFADKAYLSKEVIEQLEKQQVSLFCPEKNKKGESVWERQFNEAFRRIYGKAVSSVRQPIEAFFNWIIEKVAIQKADKVRSVKGLNIHIYGKAAAAMFILLGF